MSFDAADEESLLFKLRFRNLDGLSREERRMQYAERLGVPAERVCEKHDVASCDECFPHVHVVPRTPPRVETAYSRTDDVPRSNEPLWVRVELEPKPSRKKHRDDICSIGVDDCDWDLDDAVLRGEESLRRFCRLPRQVLAHYFDDAEFSKPIGFEAPKRKHRSAAENAKVPPVPIFAFSEAERSFYKDAASRNFNQAALRAKHGEWPMAKIIDLEARILKHAVKVGLIHLLPSTRELQLREKQRADRIKDLFFTDPDDPDVKRGFGNTKDVKSTFSYPEDRAQKAAIAAWAKTQEAWVADWLEAC